MGLSVGAVSLTGHTNQVTVPHIRHSR